MLRNGYGITAARAWCIAAVQSGQGGPEEIFPLRGIISKHGEGSHGGSALAEKRISWIWHSEGRWHAQVVVRTPSGPRVVRTTKPTLEEARRWYAEQRAKGEERS